MPDLQLSKCALPKFRIARRLMTDGIGVIALKRRSKLPDGRFCPNGSHDATTDLVRWSCLLGQFGG